MLAAGYRGAFTQVMLNGMTDSREELAARLRLLLAESGMSTHELARRTKINPSRLYRLLKGKGRYDAKVLGALAHELSVDLPELVGISPMFDELDELRWQVEAGRQRLAAEQERHKTELEREQGERARAISRAEEQAVLRLEQAFAHQAEAQIGRERLAYEERLAEFEREIEQRTKRLEKAESSQVHTRERIKLLKRALDQSRNRESRLNSELEAMRTKESEQASRLSGLEAEREEGRQRDENKRAQKRAKSGGLGADLGDFQVLNLDNEAEEDMRSLDEKLGRMKASPEMELYRQKLNAQTQLAGTLVILGLKAVSGIAGAIRKRKKRSE